MGQKRNGEVRRKDIPNLVKGLFNLGHRYTQIPGKTVHDLVFIVFKSVLNQGDSEIHVVADKDLPISVEDRTSKGRQGNNPQDVSIRQTKIFFMLGDLDGKKSKKENPNTDSDKDKKDLEPALRSFGELKKKAVP
jgi:hypothetical protein